MLHLKRLVVFLDALKKYTSEWKESRKGKSAGQGRESSGGGDKAEVMTVAELLERLGRKATGVNLLEVEAYLRRSKVTCSLCFFLMTS
jgi:chromosome transmission fidelity protein 1